MIELIETETSKWFANRDFQCPECGSSHFGTQNAHIWEKAIGSCHGQGCRFTWKREQQDELVFILKEEA